MKKFIAYQKRKTLKNEWKNDDTNFLGALYSIYEKLVHFFSTLTC